MRFLFMHAARPAAQDSTRVIVAAAMPTYNGDNGSSTSQSLSSCPEGQCWIPSHHSSGAMHARNSSHLYRQSGSRGYTSIQANLYSRLSMPDFHGDRYSTTSRRDNSVGVNSNTLSHPSEKVTTSVLPPGQRSCWRDGKFVE